MRELIPISVEILQQYKDKKFGLRFFIVESTGLRSIFLNVYNQFVSANEIVPIEKIPVAEKERLWILVSRSCPRQSIPEKKITTKCIHLIESITEERIIQI